ncbi:MAG: hypothetical protein LBN27_10755 [Prevotellaceae bacterium]|jgi:hypothetical protein|nr:hypothetical protein [Prevotellaceae bacterium]
MKKNEPYSPEREMKYIEKWLLTHSVFDTDFDRKVRERNILSVRFAEKKTIIKNYGLCENDYNISI